MHNLPSINVVQLVAQSSIAQLNNNVEELWHYIENEFAMQLIEEVAEQNRRKRFSRQGRADATWCS